MTTNNNATSITTYGSRSSQPTRSKPVKPLPTRRPAPVKTYPVCSLKKAQSIIEANCGNTYVSERHGKGMNKVIILPEAMHELEVMVSYGRRSPMNAKEQKYGGFGHFLVTEDEHVIIIVKHFIEIQTMNRTAVSASNLGPNGEYNPGLDFLEYHREEFLKGEQQYNTDAFGHQVDPFLRLCGGSEFVLEGHTHPDLGVFYSGPDKQTGAARAASSPVCIFVCDPVRRAMLGSIGKNFAEAEVIVYSRGNAPAKTNRDHEGTAGNVRMNPSLDEVARLASYCLQIPGFKGKVKVTRHPFSHNPCLKAKLISPSKGRTRGGDNK